jgi:ABC-2 type transport system permease protein
VEVLALTEAEPEASTSWLQMLLPIVAGILFVMVINTSGGYLLQAVVEEKENRTIEIVITSVSPGQLMAGKIMGNLSVGLTQLLIWLLFPVLGFLVLRRFSPLVQGLYLDPEYVWLLLLTLIPAFILIAALMATIGATATEAREAQQIAGLFTLPVVAPFWFFVPLMTDPHGTLALALSLFPLTAPVSLPLRAAFTVVPLWQSALSISLLILSAAMALWLAGRAFRSGMLHYGKRLSWRELVRR